MRKSALVLTFTISLWSMPAAAATCTVDATGSFSGSYPSIPAALKAAACIAPGAVIEVYCPSGGCTYGSVKLRRQSDLTFQSMELSGTGGPVSIAASKNWAVKVINSNNVTFDGISAYNANKIVLDVKDSAVAFTGPLGLATPRYADVQGSTGMRVRGTSNVTLTGMGFAFNELGLQVRNTGKKNPIVIAEAIALVGNTIAVEMSGGGKKCTSTKAGPRMEIRSDFGDLLLNYVMGNVEGFLLEKNSELLIDHAVLASNLHTAPSYRAEPMLFQLEHASSLEARNLLAYNNDAIFNPNTSTGWSSCSSTCLNTAGRILSHESCDFATVEASSFVDNQTDLVFHVDFAKGAGSGDLTLDHVAVANSWGKTVSTSTFTSCSAPITYTDNYFWDNRVDVDPVACFPTSGITKSPPNFTTWGPVALPAYPAASPPPGNYYTMLVPIEPSDPYPQPTGLYASGNWGVDGTTPDTDSALDVGFHNPF